ncbi:hypothetical protein [Cellulomonas endophytica]|uniref:hypothetical protein n=1 Tax=Cellulomonas endophytica TaxID=2494735 RepID=UPI0010107060|nr:hypothetical protein [Cellulomonas endophytica]
MLAALLLLAGTAASVVAAVLLVRLGRGAGPVEAAPLRPPLWVTAGLGVAGLCLLLAGALLVW